MEFIILRDADVTFSEPVKLLSTGLQGRTSSSPLEAEIQVTRHDGNVTDNQNYSKLLTAAIMKNPWTLSKKHFKTDWSLKVTIALPDPKQRDNGEMRVIANASDSVDNFLKVVHETLNWKGGDERNVTMNVVVKNFGVKRKSGDCPQKAHWNAKGLELHQTYRHYTEGMIIECSYKPLEVFQPDIQFAWKNGREFCGSFTISLVLSNSALSLLNSMNRIPKERLEHYKNLLENEICTDLEIHVGVSPEDQKVIKCHRAILAAESEVFQKMFESGMKEATGNKIEIEEMSENGVRAMLAYLYHREIKAAYESCEIALELLEAAEKYDIKSLKESVRKYMMAKESSWFGVDMALTLFVYVKSFCEEDEEEVEDQYIWEDDEYYEMCSCFGDEYKDEEMKAWESLKIKCLKVLRWYVKVKPKTLMESVKFQEIFGGNLQHVMGVCSAIFRLD